MYKTKTHDDSCIFKHTQTKHKTSQNHAKTKHTQQCTSYHIFFMAFLLFIEPGRI